MALALRGIHCSQNWPEGGFKKEEGRGLRVPVGEASSTEGVCVCPIRDGLSISGNIRPSKISYAFVQRRGGDKSTVKELGREVGRLSIIAIIECSQER